jgi:hypothetical protein
VQLEDVISVVVSVGGAELNHPLQPNSIEWRKFPSRARRNVEQSDWLRVVTSLSQFSIDEMVKEPLFNFAKETTLSVPSPDLLTELGTKGYWRAMENDVRDDPSATTI